MQNLKGHSAQFVLFSAAWHHTVSLTRWAMERDAGHKLYNAAIMLLVGTGDYSRQFHFKKCMRNEAVLLKVSTAMEGTNVRRRLMRTEMQESQ